eukprot:6191846-Pleurochrysis_carterae.AAC.1
MQLTTLAISILHFRPVPDSESLQCAGSGSETRSGHRQVGWRVTRVVTGSSAYLEALGMTSKGTAYKHLFGCQQLAYAARGPWLA